ISSFIEREHEFRFLAVTPETFYGLFYTTPSVLCACYSDEEYFMNRCEGNKEILYQRYSMALSRFGWMISYPVAFIFAIACWQQKILSEAAYENFLYHTFLGDRKTTIREYLATSGSSIMEEEPPEQLKHRYGG
ncbi:ureide permease 5, partial [Striga asiatica]